jgi:hypothetical protein
MNEQRQTSIVHRPALRERQCFSHQPTHPLPQRIVPPFHMVRQARLLTDRFMLIRRDHRLVCLPEVRVTQRPLVPTRHRPPQPLARVLATVARHERHNLPGYGTECDPHPALVVLVMHERPEFVEFKYTILEGRRDERFVQAWEFSNPFLIHPVTVWRLTPKVRVSPRKLERSW